MIENTYFLQEISETISELFNVVITIVDKDFVRVVGTHRYKKLIGLVAVNPNVFKHVMDENKTIIINNPGKDATCLECISRYECDEKAAIYTPLRVSNTIIGGIAIIAFSESQLKGGMFENENFLKFTEKLSELFASKIESQQYAQKLAIHLKENIAILNSVQDGVIAFNNQGIIYEINKSAIEEFGLTKEIYLHKNIKEILPEKIIKMLEIKKCFVDIDERIEVQNTKIAALITAQTIEKEGQIYGTVLILKSMKSANSIARKILHEADHKVSFRDIVGSSSELKEITILSKKVATSNSTILIRGESGTGKEMFARAIHNESSRSKGPFVAINCAAIPEPLLESELFGYDDGAFTGAKRGGKIGKCELAMGGTLFLDEVGDIPIFLQAKFLRVLQERSIERIGGTKTIPVDIRIIAATNKDLEEMIKSKEYREDLYYRLNVIPIFLPPLRDRKDDIVIVSQYFLEKYAEKLHKNITSIEKEAMLALSSYHWPGNLRELENAIECAMNIESESILRSTSLPSKIVKRSTSNLENKHREVQEIQPLKDSVRGRELEDVMKALDRYGWNTIGKKNAAKSLGIGIATLYRILNKM